MTIATSEVRVSADDLERLLKAQEQHAWYWEQVIKAARQYAMMEAHGAYMENGSVAIVCFNDRKQYSKMFQENLLRAACDAFRDDAVLGITLSTLKGTTS
jgi:hypothetical protein